jgi:CheY-like chemotaxis protein
MNILAIDDCEIIAEGYKYRFGAKPFTKYLDFSEELHKDRPDLLLLDLDIGNVAHNGWTITNEARELYPDVPIIIATANDESEQRALAEIKGVDFWAKGGIDDFKKLRELVTKHGTPDRLSC